MTLSSKSTPVASTMSAVTIANLETGFDTLYMNFQNPPLLNEPCEGECDGGIEGGHIDVDTDLQLGGATTKHVHAYDDKSGLTVIDFLNMFQDPDNAGKDAQNSLNKGDLTASTDFVVLIANADMVLQFLVAKSER